MSHKLNETTKMQIRIGMTQCQVSILGVYALTTWSGSRVRKQDVIVAKNYLTEDEVDILNRLVVIFLEQAELRVKQQKTLTLDYWRSSVDRMLASNDQPLLDGSGSISNELMKSIIAERYDTFDAQRRKHDALQAVNAKLSQCNVDSGQELMAKLVWAQNGHRK